MRPFLADLPSDISWFLLTCSSALHAQSLATDLEAQLGASVRITDTGPGNDPPVRWHVAAEIDVAPLSEAEINEVVRQIYAIAAANSAQVASW